MRERKKLIFPNPTSRTGQIIITQSGSDINTKADLAGLKVGIQLGSTAEDAVKSDAPVMESFSELVKYQDNVQALMDLQVGRIDAVVVDEILGRYYIAEKPEYAVAEDFFAAEEYGIGFRKGEAAFVHAVDHVLDEMAADGTAAEISIKWFGENVLLPR